MEINIDYLLNSLPFMGKGMLGIFIVTAVIVTIVNALNSIPDKKIKTKPQQEAKWILNFKSPMPTIFSPLFSV